MDVIKFSYKYNFAMFLIDDIAVLQSLDNFNFILKIIHQIVFKNKHNFLYHYLTTLEKYLFTCPVTNCFYGGAGNIPTNNSLLVDFCQHFKDL